MNAVNAVNAVTKYTNNQILGINQVIQSIDIEKTNQKTAYWAARNVRIMSKVVSEFTALQEAVRKDKWFTEFQTDIEALGIKEAEEKWKENLDAANDELKIFGEKETEIDFYTISIDKIEVPTNIIPVLMDLISE